MHEHEIPGEPGEKTLERQIRAFHWVRLLTELPGRLAGGPFEREAADRVEAWMREIGFEDVRRSPVPSRPPAGLGLALHLGLGALGCWLGGAFGLVLAGVALLSFHREQRVGVRGLGAWLGARESLNVVARAGPERPRRRVVLTAHIDAAQAGRVFARRHVERLSRWLGPRIAASRSGALALPERLLWAAALVAAASALGADGWLLFAARFVVGGLLVLGGVVMLEWGFAPPTPGANDNASGVAAMLTCGEQLLVRLPPDVELWLVGTGAEEVGLCGMRAFLDEHAAWRADLTAYVNFECVGGGALHWVRSEGGLVRHSHAPTLTELARRLARGGAFAEITAVDLAASTDGALAAARNLHALSLISLEADGVPRNYHRAEDTAEALDMELVVRAADFADAVVVAWLRGAADPLAIV
ncbi:MAG: M28 family metallopeptidase [Myxococcales bacterium]|nr:M28 family metallopeptidase [Myxococcales bacterium]MDH5566163.1 M28 family metallopeptidase [Myxococcales bacterium]